MTIDEITKLIEQKFDFRIRRIDTIELKKGLYGARVDIGVNHNLDFIISEDYEINETDLEELL